MAAEPRPGPRQRGPLALAVASLFALLASSPREAAAVEPWSDADPPSPPSRYALGDFGFRGAAEYRAQWSYINPISPSTETGRRASWIEHRLRVDGGVDYLDKIRLIFSADVLDGTLWGDNGTLGTEPAPNSGSNINTRNPNVSRPCIGLRSGDPLDQESYGFVPCPQEVLNVRRMYGEVVLPIGLIRVGRQAMNEGTGVQAADGNGRKNRFGVARTGNLVDRILFATKPLEAFKPAEKRDRSETKGFFAGVGYDRLVTESPHLFGDDVQQVVSGVRLVLPEHPIGHDLFAALNYVHRWDTLYASAIHNVNARAYSSFGPVQAGFDAAMNLGSTREVTEAYRVLSNDPVVDQTVRQFGARAVVRFDQPLFTAYLEADYASGDGDPQARTPLTQFLFAEDTNVGLLLFEHVLAFQSARAAAAAVETLRRLGATTFPAEAIATRGAFTDAFAIFPQLDLRPHDDLLFRVGALFAWAPEPVADPVASLQARDGLTIEDDLVNFVGGKPAAYYGTELDARFQWRFLNHFLFDLEGAILFPGEALENEDGYAVRSVLVQGRTTLFF